LIPQLACLCPELKIRVTRAYFLLPMLADKTKSVVQKLIACGRDLDKYDPIYLIVVTNASQEAMGDGSVNTFRMLKRLGRPELMPGIARAERRDELLAELEQARHTEFMANANRGVFERIHGTYPIEPHLGYYESLKAGQAQARARVVELEKQLPEKEQAIISPMQIPGLKVHICTLVAPDSPPDNWMDVYVHSKLMIVDDAFCTLGSANVNTRSMQVDSELNICIEDPAITRPLREHLFGVHTGGGVARSNMKEEFRLWGDIIAENKLARGSAHKNEYAAVLSPVASLVEFMQESTLRKNLD
jgi:hypothetical protein